MKTLVTAVLVVALTLARGSAETPTAETLHLEVPTTQFTLPNGLHLILHQDRSVPIVSVNVWYHVGSANERTGRTGFAHLFEHIMFMGSGHVGPGAFDEWLEGAGGNNNGSTDNDRTNYWIDVPSNALELALFLESDRMGYLLDTMTPQVVDAQRDVVKNERRQSYENRPYGMADLALGEMLYPEGHPYRWPVIGHMDDLSAATYEDVVEFFKTYYAPSNASLVIAGDIDIAEARRLVEKWFSDVPARPAAGPMTIPGVELTSVVRRTMADQVQLPRLTLAWLTPRHLTPGDAELDVVADVLAGGRSSRLYRRLVYELQIAQDVEARQASAALSSYFYVQVLARPDRTAEEIQRVVDEEIARLQAEGPTEREVQRAVNKIEASFYTAMERIGGFGGKADRLNAYYTATGIADWFNQDLARYRALSPADIRAAARHFLPAARRAELVVLPEERQP